MCGYTALSSARMNTDRVEHSPAYCGQVRRRSIVRMPSWSTANLRIGRGEGVAVTFSSLPPRSQEWISQRASVRSGAGAVESMWAASRNASAHRHRSEPCDSRRMVSTSSWGKVCRSGTPLKSDMARRMALFNRRKGEVDGPGSAPRASPSGQDPEPDEGIWGQTSLGEDVEAGFMNGGALCRSGAGAAVRNAAEPTAIDLEGGGELTKEREDEGACMACIGGRVLVPEHCEGGSKQ